MNGAVTHFFVMLQRVQNVSRANAIQPRQAAYRSNSSFDSRTLLIGEPTQRTTDSCCGNHSITYRFTVFEAPILACRLQRVSNRMAEIQNAPQIGLLFISHHNMRLDRSASGDEPFN